MNRIGLAAILALSLLSGCAPHVPSPGKYAPDDIKTLTPSEIRSLLDGDDMGYSRAAELNDYPAPAQVLEHGRALRLRATQVTATRALVRRQKAEAQALGAKLIEAERALNRAFATRTIDQTTLVRMTNEIGRHQAAIRASHLSIYLAQTNVLSRAQLDRFAALRQVQAKLQ